MIKIHKTALFRDERGVEIIEFAFMLPLLLILLAGGIEFGRAFYTYNIVTKSVRHSARYISDTIISPSAAIPAEYVNKAKKVAAYGSAVGGAKILPDIKESYFTVTGEAGNSVNEFYVTVSADYPYSPLFEIILRDTVFHPKVTMPFTGYIRGPGV